MDAYLIYTPTSLPEANLVQNVIDARECYAVHGKATIVKRVTDGYPVIDVTADFYLDLYGEEYEEPRPFKFRVVGGAVEKGS